MPTMSQTWSAIVFSAMGKRNGVPWSSPTKSMAIWASIPPWAPRWACWPGNGLQVSTGASMGHGLFALSSAEGEASVKARFEGGDRVLELRLKPENETIIRADIRKGRELYGNSAQYWSYVRELALRYWLEWDRTRIFSIAWKGDSTDIA